MFIIIQHLNVLCLHNIGILTNKIDWCQHHVNQQFTKKSLILTNQGKCIRVIQFFSFYKFRIILIGKVQNNSNNKFDFGDAELYRNLKVLTHWSLWQQITKPEHNWKVDSCWFKSSFTVSIFTQISLAWMIQIFFALSIRKVTMAKVFNPIYSFTSTGNGKN